MSTEVFGEIYSSLYDKLYESKDYEEECNFLEAIFKKYNIAPKTILDLGCGGGEFLNSFNKKWQKFGVEPSVFASKIAAAKKHLEVRNQELLTCHFPDSYFDIVTAWHVLEHLYNPKETLREMRRILKDDGVFLLSTPNTDSLGFKLAKESWFHLDAPRHLSLFNRLALKKILTSSRFRILKTSFPVLEYPLDLFHSISKAKLKNQFLRGVFTAPLFILLITLKPFLCLLGIGETMEVISVKTKKDS